jgi:aspartate/tyrosine/aromatic aminotransferase
MYISPPKYGAEIVSTVLSDPALMEEWWVSNATVVSKSAKM